MVIIESGLIINGLPIIRSEYYPKEIGVDPFIQTGLFTAIQSFASDAFMDEVEEMKFKRYSILIKDLEPLTHEQKILYIIAEKGTDLSEAKKRLAALAKKLDLENTIYDTPTMTNELKAVKKEIDDYLKDLAIKPADRAKSVFGQ